MNYHFGKFWKPLCLCFLGFKGNGRAGYIGHSLSALSREQRVRCPSGFVSLRQLRVWVSVVVLNAALRGWHGPALPEVSIGLDAVCGHQGLLRGAEDISALVAGGSWRCLLMAQPLSDEPGEACQGHIEVVGLPLCHWWNTNSHLPQRCHQVTVSSLCFHRLLFSWFFFFFKNIF